MKIGQIQIDVYFDQEQGATLTAPEEVHQGPKTGTVENSTSTEEVQLNPDSANFEVKKPELEAGWFGDATEIELSQDDPNFVAKKESLKSAGFKWNPTAKAWHKPKDNNGSRKSARHRVSKFFLLSAIALVAGMS